MRFCDTIHQYLSISSMFKLTFLGTSSGIPTRERNVSALAVECSANVYAKRNAWLLIDCGEGTQHQLMRCHLSPNDLSAILITHTHGDHCYGLGGLLASLNMNRRTKPLTLIAPKAIARLLDTLTVVSELHFNYPIDFIAIEDNLECELSLDFGDNHHIAIRFYELSHRILSFGFTIIQTLKKDKLLTDKLRLDDIANGYWHKILKADTPLKLNDRTINPHDYKTHTQSTTKIVIAGDNDTPNLLTHAVKDCHALIHEATYTDEILQKIVNKPAMLGGFNHQHSSAKQVATFAHACHVPMLILTHFSARYAPFDDKTAKEPNMGHLRDEAERYYDGKLVLAKDFLQVVVNADDN